MGASLSVSRLINVDVILAAFAAQSQSLSNLLVLSTSAVIDVVERLRSYTNITDVGTDFGTTGIEYQAAVLWFQQRPQPQKISIGRWAKTPSAGKLLAAPLIPANQLIAPWAAITTGSLKIGFDAVAALDVTGINLSGAANLNAVAALIQTAIRAANAAAGFTAATVIYNGVYQRFEITSGTTGAGSSVTFMAAAASGVDLSAMIHATAASSGAYVAPGIVAETALAAATLFDSQFGRIWYGLMIPDAVDADHIAVAPFIEATANKHVYTVTTQEGGVLSPVGTTDIAYVLKQLNLNKTMVQYSSQNAQAGASLASRAFNTDWNGNNTAITLMYKQEPGIVAESVTETQAEALEAKNCNVFVNYDNSTAIIQDGVMSSGEFIDTIVGADALAVDVQTSVFNAVYTSPTKIPQTDAGNDIIVAVIKQVMDKYVTNAFLAPGVWDQAGFGTLKEGDFLKDGYYVYAPPIASQLKADRQARKSVTFQVAAKCAGAVHTFDVQLNISR